MPETDEARDIFYRQDVYPDATGLMSWSPETLQQVKDVAIVVVDTNALLVPYGTGKASLDEIGGKYHDLVDKNRLVVPGQVVREFASNRALKLQELHQQLNRRRQVAVIRGSYPLLEGLDGYQQMIEMEGQLDQAIKSYRDSVDLVIKQVRRWHWNDPVSALYRELLTPEIVLDPALDREELKRDLAKRIANSIPPGYKDSRKHDGGLGDLIIWRTILDIGKSKKAHLIFVSGDQKTDWWHQSEGSALYPRFELIDEYRRSSGGKTLHLITFSDFLELSGASQNIVEEVRKEEQELSIPSTIGPGTTDWTLFDRRRKIRDDTLEFISFVLRHNGDFQLAGPGEYRQFRETTVSAELLFGTDDVRNYLEDVDQTVREFWASAQTRKKAFETGDMDAFDKDSKLLSHLSVTLLQQLPDVFDRHCRVRT